MRACNVTAWSAAKRSRSCRVDVATSMWNPPTTPGRQGRMPSSFSRRAREAGDGVRPWIGAAEARGNLSINRMRGSRRPCLCISGRRHVGSRLRRRPHRADHDTQDTMTTTFRSSPVFANGFARRRELRRSEGEVIALRAAGGRASWRKSGRPSRRAPRRTKPIVRRWSQAWQ